MKKSHKCMATRHYEIWQCTEIQSWMIWECTQIPGIYIVAMANYICGSIIIGSHAVLVDDEEVLEQAVPLWTLLIKETKQHLLVAKTLVCHQETGNRNDLYVVASVVSVSTLYYSPSSRIITSRIPVLVLEPGLKVRRTC